MLPAAGGGVFSGGHVQREMVRLTVSCHGGVACHSRSRLHHHRCLVHGQTIGVFPVNETFRDVCHSLVEVQLGPPTRHQGLPCLHGVNMDPAESRCVRNVWCRWRVC